jgi:uncharacterized protein YfaS (alpha-2-macroglobulin family)
MNPKHYLSLLFLPLIFIVAYSCDTSSEQKHPGPEYSAYVSSYTAGIVTSHAHVIVRLNNKSLLQNHEDIQELFEFSPSIEGKVELNGDREFNFIPDEPMESGTHYNVVFKLSKVAEVPNELSNFEFGFDIIEQNYQVFVDGLEAYDESNLSDQKVKGRVIFADDVNENQLKTFFKAEQDGENLEVQYNFIGNREIGFEVQHAKRMETTKGELKISFSGKAVGIDQNIERKVSIPALNEFDLTNVIVSHAPEQRLELWFSDPVKEQELLGLINISGNPDLRFETDKNRIIVFTVNDIFGKRTLSISDRIQNIQGYDLGTAIDTVIEFRDIKPQIVMPFEGFVLPSGNGHRIAFEAVNLKAVDLFVVKIYENNVLQFLQENSYRQQYGLRSVGSTILKKHLALEKLTTENLKQWNRFYINLDDVIDVEKGAIYHVELRFKHDYSIYSCDALEPTEGWDYAPFEEENDESVWENYYSNDNYWDYYYDWSERENPCNKAFYNEYNASVKTNFIASDLGILAKAGSDKSVHFTVTDLISASPVSGATVDVFDFQQQRIAKGTTDDQGHVRLTMDKKPFVALARRANSVSYLKMIDGEALSMSTFDVSGVATKQGVKGILYGERGVWRPGDSLFLTFVLEDKKDILPADFPVVMEVYNPLSQMVFKKVQTHAVDGFYDFRFATKPEDPTGNYQVNIGVGNRTFYSSLKIETVKPNRLKINLDFGAEKLYSKDGITGDMQVRWLHGATASNLKAQVSMSVSNAYTQFKGFEEYSFQDDFSRYEYAERSVFDNELDSDGYAKIKADINATEAPGMLRLSFNTNVFEPGGSFSVDRQSVTYSPYSTYAGIKIPDGKMWGNIHETDKPVKIDVARLDEFGKPKDGKVMVEVYYITRNWWYDRYYHGQTQYMFANGNRRLKRDTLNVTEGKSSFSFTAPKRYYGRYIFRITDLSSGHVTAQVAYFDWPYWARSERGDEEVPNVLGIALDKERYNTGETAVITFPSTENSKALLSIENGNTVLQTYWIDTKKGETSFSIPLTSNMAPNVYCFVTLLQPHNQTENDRPIRLFGVVPMMVEDPGSHLKPMVNCPDVWRPESNVEVVVSEENGKPMTYTLAIVDEGLLDLTRFKTPNLWNHFYAREYLGVKTWDFYDEIIGAYGSSLPNLLNIGGGELSVPDEPVNANRFKPMVRFYGPYQLKPGQKRVQTVDIPNYVGSVRVMVVAGKSPGYGSKEKTVPVRKPLMVLGTLPRVLSPGEEVALPVSVFAMEPNVKEAKIDLEVNQMFEIVGKSQQKATFNEPGDQLVVFRLKVKQKVGLGKVSISAKGSGERAHHDIELEVRAPNPRISEVVDTVFQAGTNGTIEFDYFGINGTNAATLELSTIPAMDLERRLEYLIRYPHGCLEQTTSSAFPQLYLNGLTYLSKEDQEDIQFNISEAITKLIHFQKSNGSFSYWPGTDYYNDWSTIYAGHFMLEAEKKGYNLPSSMKKKWINHEKSLARNWKDDKANRYDEFIQVYRLYVLALSGNAQMGAMNNLRQFDNLQPSVQWRLAAAYAIAGQEEVAKKMTENLAYEPVKKDYYYYGFGSKTRDRAFILEAQTILKDFTKGAELAKKIAEDLSSSRWLSTQSTAYALIAMSKFLNETKSGKPLKATYRIGGGPETNVDQPIPLYSDKFLEKGASGSDKIKIENNGQGMLFARIVLNGIPLVDNTTNVAENLKMNVRYKALSGASLDPGTIKQGTDFIAVVTIENPGTAGSLSELALTHMFPSGWEIINQRMREGESSLNNDYFTYQDVRDDEVLTYFNLSTSTYRKTFEVQLNATYQGKFYMPSVYCEAMYDDEVRASVRGRWVNVVP